MTQPTIAALLGIESGSRVWLIGDTVEESSLLDPLPDGVEIFTTHDFVDHATDDVQDQTWGAVFLEPEPEAPHEQTRPHGINTAVIVVSHPQEFHRTLDETLPRMGSVARAWILYAAQTLPTDVVTTGISDYGWSPAETFPVNDTWQALRITQ